jgi:hypothetical protein
MPQLSNIESSHIGRETHSDIKMSNGLFQNVTRLEHTCKDVLAVRVRTNGTRETKGSHARLVHKKRSVSSRDWKG